MTRGVLTLAAAQPGMRSVFVAPVLTALVGVAAAAPAVAAESSGPGPFRIMADMVQAGVCVSKSVFAPGEPIVIRAAIADAATGAPLTAEQVAARGIKAVVTFKDGQRLPLRFGLHPPPEVVPNAPARDDYWAGTYVTRPTHPTGTLPWTLEVTDASGNRSTFAPIGQKNGTAILTLVPAAAPPVAPGAAPRS